jgi:hypothetical protein
MIWPGSLFGRYRVATNPLKTERRLELLVILLTTVLILQILYSGTRLFFGVAPGALVPSADVLQVVEVPGPAVLGEVMREGIRSRPLFWQGRRPLEGPDSVASGAAGESKARKLPGVKLLGVFGGGETAGIIVLVKDKKRRILLGESIEGWTLESVATNTVVLADGVRREEIVLKKEVIRSATDGKRPKKSVLARKNGNGTTPQSTKRRLSLGDRPMSGAKQGSSE